MVGQLRFRDHLPQARRAVHAAEHRRRDPVAPRAGQRRRDVHPEPDQRRRRARDRGELGTRRGGGRRVASFPTTSGSTATVQVVERVAGVQEGDAAHAARRRHRGADGCAGASRGCRASTTRSSRSSTSSRRKCEEVYGPSRDIEWAFADGELYLLQCRAVTRAGSSGLRPPPPDAPPPPEVVVQVPFFAGLDDDEVHAISHMFKERRFPAGDTIAKEGAGGAAFFVIDSGEAVVTVHGREVATLTRGRPLRRGGAHRRRRALGDSLREDRRRLLRAHVLGVPSARTAAMPSIAWNLLQEFAKRLRSAQER